MERDLFDLAILQAADEARERRRKLVVVVENDRPAVVHRFDRDAIVARKRVCDRTPQHLLDVLSPDLRQLVVAADDD